MPGGNGEARPGDEQNTGCHFGRCSYFVTFTLLESLSGGGSTVSVIVKGTLFKTVTEILSRKY